MNKKLIGFSIVTVLLTAAIALPTSAMAFWPFTSGGGQVQGAQTPSMGFYEIVQNFYHQLVGYYATTHTTESNTTATHGGELAPRGATGVRYTTGYAPFAPPSTMGLSISKEQLDKAVAAGKITQAQETEILNQMAAIRTKQQELVNLQIAFRNWLMANHITSAMLLPPKPTGASGYEGGHTISPMPTHVEKPYTPGNPSGETHATGGYYNPQTNK